MRLSIVVPVPETIGLLDFEKDVIKASELGYDGIELNIRDPTQIDRKRVLEIISTQGLDVSSVLTGRVFSVDGLSLTYPDKKLRKQTITRIKDARAQVS